MNQFSTIITLVAIFSTFIGLFMLITSVSKPSTKKYAKALLLVGGIAFMVSMTLCSNLDAV